MILPLETVFALERLHVGVALDRARILTADDAEEFGKFHRRKSWAKLCEAAMTYAVDLDERDIVVDEITTEHDRDRNRVVFRTRWSPQSNELEFVGGPADGQCYAVQRPREPFVIVVEAPTVFGPGSVPDPAAQIPTPRHVNYYPAGWNETTRRWVSSCEEQKQ